MRNSEHCRRIRTWISLSAVLLIGGCQSSTIESRRLERQSGYDALSSEQRQLVDEGKIRVGMNEDAVFIAWGKPDQILQSETKDGITTTWLYHGHVLESQHAWRYREIQTHNGATFLERYLDQDYQSRDYVRAEIVFREGAVVEWRTLAKPTNNTVPRYY